MNAIFFIFSITLAIIYFFIVYGYIYHSKHVDSANKYLGVIGLSAVFIVLSFLPFKTFTENSLIGNGIFLIIILYSPILLALGLTFLSTISMKVINLYPEYKLVCFKNLEVILTGRINGMKKHGKDTLRKTNHVLMFISLIFVWITSLIVVENMIGSSIGMLPREPNMLLTFIDIIFNLRNLNEIILTIGWFYYVLFYFYSIM